MNFHRWTALLEMPLDGLRLSMQVYEDIGDARASAQLEPDIEQRLAANGDETFGNGVGERAQTRAMASSQQKSFHNALFRSDLFGLVPREPVSSSQGAGCASEGSCR